LLLSSRFRRAGPAASPRAPDTVITCGGVHDEGAFRGKVHVQRSTHPHGICICMCMHIYAHTCIYLHVCKYVCMSLPVYILTCIHVDVCADVSRCVCVCACRYVSMHSFVLVMLHACELFRNRYTLTKNPTPSTPNIHHTICPLPHCRRARQGQRAWTAINAPPWHLQHHTSHRNTICIPTLCMPTPHTSMT